jgi:hypothetical protein
VYSALLVVGLVVMTFSLSKLRPFQAGVVRLPGAPYYVDSSKGMVRNQFQLRLMNKRMSPQTFRITLEGATADTLLTGPGDTVTLEPQQERLVAAIVEIPRASYRGAQPMAFVITSEPGGSVMRKKFEFTGPDPRLLDDTFLKP